MAESFDIVLDMKCKRNRNPFFLPLNKTLRGEILDSELVSKDKGWAVSAVGGIPGDRMLVDTKNRKVRIVDKMTLPENAEKDIAIRKVTQTEDYYDSRYGRYKLDENHEVSEHDWPTWLWHMRRLVDHKRAVLVEGRLPEYADILRMDYPVLLGESCNLKPSDPTRPFWQLDSRDADMFQKPKAAKPEKVGAAN